ncbi:MAG: tail fiber protein [Saprospiraceae bacterium]
MKRRNLIQRYLLLFLGIIYAAHSTAQVAINQDNSNPDPSAMLDVKSADKGVLVPRMTSPQRTAVASPAVGLLVFDTDTESFWFRDSTAWVEIRGGNAFSQGLLLGEDCFIITTLDANFDAQSLNDDDTSVDPNQWQSFTAENSGYLTSVEIKTFEGLGSGELFSNGTFKVFQGQGTSGPLLYEAFINETWGTGWHSVSIPFDSSIYISAGSVYTINFINQDDFIWYEYDDSDNVYSGGMSSGGPNSDFSFKIHLSTCELHYLIDPPTIAGTTNLNHIDTIFFADGSIQTSFPIQIADADKDTKIQVEEAPDEDMIRFDLAGTEYFRMEKGRLVFDNANGISIGKDAGKMLSNGGLRLNTFVGNNAGKDWNGGFSNTVVGENAMQYLNNGSHNSALGAYALYRNTTGISNIGIGYTTGYSNQSGSENVFIGSGAGYTGINKNKNVAIGYEAGRQNQGDNNIFLGYQAGRNSSGSDKLYIENSESEFPLLYGEFDNDLLRVNGTLNINNAFSFPTIDGVAGQVLVTDGVGQIFWMDNVAGADDQTLSLSGTTLSIENGNSVVLAGINTDDQSLSLSGTSLSIEGGNSVDLSTLPGDNLGTHTASQTLNLNGNYLSGDGDNEGIFVDNDGMVGIGTTVPARPLDVFGAIRSTKPGGSPDGSSIEFTSPSNLPGIVFRLGDGLGGELRRWDFRFDNDGSILLRDRTYDITIFKADETGALVHGTMTADNFVGDGSALTGIADDQALSLSGNTLSIEDGNSVDLSTIDTDTDDQTLSLSGGTLSIEDGNSVDLSTIDTDTDDQSLSLSGTILSIEDGNSVDLSTIDTDTDDQTLSLSGATLSIQDGNSVDLSSLAPVGVIQMWPTATPPAGWLICDGSSFNAATYPALNAVLGGNTLPNFKGRFPLGANFPVVPGGFPHALGSTGGEEEHTLTVAEMPSHSHTITYSEGQESGDSSTYSDLSGTGVTDNTGNTGGGQPHNNMPPYFVINFIIKAQ